MAIENVTDPIKPSPVDLDEPLSMRHLVDFLFETYRVRVNANTVRGYRIDGLAGKKLQCTKFAGRVYCTRREAIAFFGPPPITPQNPTMESNES